MKEIWFPNLGIEIQHLNKVAFTLFGNDIYWYGIFIGTGIFLGMQLMINEAKKSNQNSDEYIDLLMLVLIFGIVGARLYYVAFSWENYKDNIMSIFALREGGIAIYGGVLGGLITIYVYSKIKKKDFLTLTDTIAPSLILGQAIGRWGNFFNREAFGDYTDSLFAMRYPVFDVRISDVSEFTLENMVNIDGVQYIQVHPTFLYESIWNFGVLAFLLWFNKRKKFSGQITAGYFITYGIGRFFIEGLRTDQLQFGGFAVSQVLSIVLITGSIILLIYRNNQFKKGLLVPCNTIELQEEEPKAEEKEKEEPKSEEPKSEEPKAEELKAEEPKVEEPKSEEPKSEEQELIEKPTETKK